jgi:murein DD-endopeptidase MepM/ murein hydrolase activator NlpD
MTPHQLEDYEKQAETKLKQLEFLTPAGDRSSTQGVRRDPLNKRRIHEHRGIDYGGMHGSPVDSAYPGKIVSADSVGRTNYGKYIVIMTNTPKGVFYTLYGHLSGIDVTVGQNIKLGQSIGRLGSTGYSSGPHLHIEKRSENTFSQGRGEYLQFTELSDQKKEIKKT